MTHDSSLLRNYYSTHAASPCRGGAGARPWRDRTVAAFIWPVAKPLNGSQVRRGHLLVGSLPALLSRARETWPETICLASHRLGNLATGGAQTAPGCAAADSLPSQAAPASPLINPNRTHTDNGKHTDFLHAATHPGYCALILHAGLAGHYGESAAQLDGLPQAIYSAPSGGAQQCGNPEGYRRPRHMNARRLLLIPNCNTRDFPRVGLRREAGSEQPRALVRGKTRGKSLMARRTHPQVRRARPPRDRTGGAMRQGGHLKSPTRSPVCAPESGYFSMTATNERTT